VSEDETDPGWFPHSFGLSSRSASTRPDIDFSR